MHIVWVYLAVSEGAYERAITTLKASDWQVNDVAAGILSMPEPYTKTIVITVPSPYSKYVRRTSHLMVLERLRSEGIQFQLIAVDAIKVRSRFSKRWPTGPTAQPPAALPEGDREAFPFIVAADPIDAAARIGELNAARNAFDAVPPGPAPVLTPAERRDRRRIRFIEVVLWTTTVVLAIPLGRYGATELWPGFIFIAWVLVHPLVRLLLIRKEKLPDSGSKLLAVLLPSVVVLATGGLAYSVYQVLHTGVPWQYTVGVFLVIGVARGLVIQLREWGIGKLYTWLVPIGITLATLLTPFLGFLTYDSYLERLGLPYDALDFTTAEQAWAGALGMLIWSGALVFVIGCFGLLTWLAGPTKIAAVILVVAACVTFLLIVIGVTTKAINAAATGYQNTLPAAWYAIRPELACFRSSTPIEPLYGPPFDTTAPRVLLGQKGSNWVVWYGDYWVIPMDGITVDPMPADATAC